MKVRTHISKALRETENRVRYDAEVKKLLSNKTILAWILKYSVTECKRMSIEFIRECIEGEPIVGRQKVRPGYTPEEITGMNTEDKAVGEGEINFDIRFYLILPGKKRVKLIMDVEAQKNYYPGYNLAARGIFYCGRMLSSQLDREFTADNYDNIKKVYSIFICMEAPRRVQNTITEYKMGPVQHFGNFRGKARYDLLSLMMICLGEGKSEENQLLGMLNILLSNTLSVREKEELLLEKYNMEMEVEIREALNTMCNLSELIEERGIRKGMRRGIKKGVQRGVEQGFKTDIEKLLRKGYSAETISELLEHDIKLVKRVQDNMLQSL